MGRLFLDAYCFFLIALITPQVTASSPRKPSRLPAPAVSAIKFYKFSHSTLPPTKRLPIAVSSPNWLEKIPLASPQNNDLVLDPYIFTPPFEKNALLVDNQTIEKTTLATSDHLPIASFSMHSESLLHEPENFLASPYYLTGGQDFIPFGRFSSAMITPPLTAKLGQTASMPLVIGYQPIDSGPFAAFYAFRSNIEGKFEGTPGFDGGYRLKRDNMSAEIGASYMASLADATGFQSTGSGGSQTFGGFASESHGTQAIRTVPAVDIYGQLSIDRYKLLAEWVVALRAFNQEDLSFNGKGAQPQAGHLEAGVNFTAFDKTAGIALGYQWSEETLALNLPNRRISGVFDIEWWKNTKQRFEYRHDKDFAPNQFANGAAPAGATNLNSLSSGKTSDTLIAQISIYF
ncbi:MAG: LbtU family siderophore porin [Legionella sp.]|nr:LbtU family siderophore porin [Legionella sp.]